MILTLDNGNKYELTAITTLLFQISLKEPYSDFVGHKVNIPITHKENELGRFEYEAIKLQLQGKNQYYAFKLVK